MQFDQVVLAGGGKVVAGGARHSLGQLKGLPDEDISSDMYLMTQDLCEAAGLPAYEVSNHAKSGQESRHNLIYWRMGDYVGIGPGAHGRVTLNGLRWATEAPRAPGDWLARVERGEAGELPREAVSKEEQATEYLLMSMRLAEGMDVARYERLSPAPLPAERVARLEELGLLRHADGRLAATDAGRAVLNGILRELAA